MPASLEIRNDRLGEVAEAVEALTRNAVYVGIPATAPPRKDEPITNASIAYVHEHGSPALNIPPRPFLRPGVASAAEPLAERLEDAARLAMDGNRNGVLRTLHAVGLIAQAAVRRKITEGPFAALSERTLAARRARGVTRTKPLIDTGQLRNAINYVVRGPWFGGK